jgi:hypothetical protein
MALCEQISILDRKLEIIDKVQLISIISILMNVYQMVRH